MGNGITDPRRRKNQPSITVCKETFLADMYGQNLENINNKFYDFTFGATGANSI
jgi:hypothetical protein